MDQRTFYLEQPASLKEMDAIESIFRHFQMNTVDVQRKLNDDASASALFDMLLFYESTSLLNCSRNTMGASAWISLSQLVKRSERKKGKNHFGFYKTTLKGKFQGILSIECLF